eukprot:g4195.t1
MAVRLQRPAFVEFLLTSGADITRENNRGRNVGHHIWKAEVADDGNGSKAETVEKEEEMPKMPTTETYPSKVLDSVERQMRDILVEGWMHRIVAVLRASRKFDKSRQLGELLRYGDLLLSGGIKLDELARLVGTAAKYSSADALTRILQTLSPARLRETINRRPDGAASMNAIEHAIVGNRPNIVRILKQHGAAMDIAAQSGVAADTDDTTNIRAVLPSFTPSRQMLRCLREKRDRIVVRSSGDGGGIERTVLKRRDSTSADRLFDYCAVYRLSGRPSKLQRSSVVWRYPAEDFEDFTFPHPYNAIFFGWPFLSRRWRESRRGVSATHHAAAAARSENKYGDAFGKKRGNRATPALRSAPSRLVTIFFQQDLDASSLRFSAGRVTFVSPLVVDAGVRVGDRFVRVDGIAVTVRRRQTSKELDARIERLLRSRSRPLRVDFSRQNAGHAAQRGARVLSIGNADCVVYSSVLHQASDKPNIYFTSLTFPCDSRGCILRDEDADPKKASDDDDDVKTTTASEIDRIGTGGQQQPRTPPASRSAMAICLFSHWPFLEMQEDLLLELFSFLGNAQLASNDATKEDIPSTVANRIARIDDLVEGLMKFVPLPAPGGAPIAVAIGEKIVAMCRRPRSHALPLTEASMLDTLFSCFNVETVLELLSYMLTSHSVLIVSNEIDLLTPISEALFSLMFPLRLAHIYIPVLPPSEQYVGYLRAPVPLFAGLHTSALELVFSDASQVNVVVANVDTGALIPPIGRCRFARESATRSDGADHPISAAPVALIPDSIRRITAREIKPHIHPVVGDGDERHRSHVTVDVHHVRTSCVRMMCALLDDFTPKMFDLSVNGQDPLAGGCQGDAKRFARISRDPFYANLFESQTWVQFVEEYLCRVTLSAVRQAQLDVFERYRSVWTTPCENRGRLPAILFPHIGEKDDDFEGVVQKRGEESTFPIVVDIGGAETTSRGMRVGDVERRLLSRELVRWFAVSSSSFSRGDGKVKLSKSNAETIREKGMSVARNSSQDTRKEGAAGVTTDTMGVTTNGDDDDDGDCDSTVSFGSSGHSLSSLAISSEDDEDGDTATYDF